MRTRLRFAGAPIVAALACWAILGPAAVAEQPPLLRLGDRLQGLDPAVSAGSRAEVDLERLSVERSIALELPGGRLLAADRSHFERRERDDFLWAGRTESGEEVVLTARGGRLAGTVFGVDGVYQISPAGEGAHEVLLLDRDPRAACDGAPLLGPAATPSASRRAVASARSPRIDLLVLYASETSAAVGSRRNMETVVRHYVDVTNIALHNSDVDARVRLAHSAEVVLPSGVRGNNAALLGWLRASEDVADLRARHGADLVGVLYEPSARFCGSASMIFRPGGPTLTHAFFNSRRLCGADTFAHEVGHLLGADHNPENATVAAGEYIYGRGHYHDGRYRTIMSYANPCTGGCPAQPFFSNPAVRHDRRATGLRNERDNARIIDELAGFVAEFSAAIDDSETCDLSPGDPDYCRECGPCLAGEGACDGDSECVTGLDCVAGAGSAFGFGSEVGVCQAGGGCDLDPGDPDYCRLCGPCGFGAGDCDSDRECQPGLICLDDVGATYGLADSSDVCGFRQGDFCPFPPGHPDFCRACGPCEPGEGGCRVSGECVPFADCFEDVGAQFGFRSDVNVCLRAAPGSCAFQPGDPDYCKACGVCGPGEGDCDTDRECRSGLTCVDGAGAGLGFGAGIDLCLESEPGGSALAAPRRLKARVLSATRVRLKWKDKSADEQGFHAEMSLEGAPFVRVASTAPNRKKLLVEALESGSTYTFRVQAFNASGTSAFTREVTVTTP